MNKCIFQLRAGIAVHCRAWNCPSLTRLKEANFDCGCIIVRSFLPCSIYYSWFFLNPSWLQALLALDKKQQCKATSPFPYGLYYCWDDCRFDLSTDGSWKYVSECWLLVIFHLLLDGADFILEFAQWSICSSLLVMLSVGINFMEDLPSNLENEWRIIKCKFAIMTLKTRLAKWGSLSSR